MYISKFAKFSFVLALIVGGLFLFSEASFAQDITPPNAPVIKTPLNNVLPEGEVYLRWTATDNDGGSGIAGYSYQMDDQAATSADNAMEGEAAQKRYKLSQGIYYFHVRSVDAEGNWSTLTTHFKLDIKEAPKVLDDFTDDDRTPTTPRHNLLGGDTYCGTDGLGSTCTATLDTGAVRLNYNVGSTADRWAAYFTRFRVIQPDETWKFANLSAYQALSFKVKGAVGGEKFTIKLNDSSRPLDSDQMMTQPFNVNSYLKDGVTNEWQEVIIPVYAFRSQEFPVMPPLNWSEMNTLAVVFEQSLASGSGTVYIDDIKFTSGHALLDSFDAENPLPQTPEDNIPPYNIYENDGATIVLSYVSGFDAYGESGSSLRIDYTVPAPPPPPAVLTASSIVRYNFPGPTNVSHLNTLGFYVKGAAGGERFYVYLKYHPTDGTKRKGVYIVRYLTTRDDWHYVSIPLEDFRIQGVDLKTIYTVEISFEQEEAAGSIYIDQLEFTNKLYKDTSVGSVNIQDNKLYINGLPFTVRAVGYQPTPIGKKPYSTVPDDPYSDPDFHDLYYDYPSDPAKSQYNADIWERDLSLLQAMGINTIRTWGKVTSTAFLDACLDHGIYVIMGFDIPEDDPSDGGRFYFNLFSPGGPEPNPDINDAIANRTYYIDDFATYVEAYKNHPAVLMWAISNEVNYRYGGDIWDENGYVDPIKVNNKRTTMREFYTLVNELARTAYEIEGSSYHPTMCPNGDVYFIGDGVAMSKDASMNYLDMWGANVYRGRSFTDTVPEYKPDGNLFEEYKAASTKPLVITEYGIDVYDNVNSVEYPATQAEYVTALWQEVMDNADVCVGASIMEYSDEWWKDDDVTASPSTHDTGGAASPIGNPDGFSNEEYYGIVEIAPDGTWDTADGIDDIRPRQVYYDLLEKMAQELLVDSFDGGTDPYTDPNPLGGVKNVIESPGTVATLVYDAGVSGESVKIEYTLDNSYNAYAGFWESLGPYDEGTGDVDPPLDARAFNTLSFWVKGETGGELFRVGLRGPLGPSGEELRTETKIFITDYLTAGVTKEWQKVSIPLTAFENLVEEGWDVRDSLALFSIVFEKMIYVWEGEPPVQVAYPNNIPSSGAIYIDDIKFERQRATSTLFVDNFNDEFPTNSLGANLWTYSDAGASITTSEDITNPYGGAGTSYAIEFTATTTDHCAWSTGLNGIDVTAYDTLVFYIKGNADGLKPNVYLYDYKNNSTYKRHVDIEDYTEVTTDWEKVAIPLSAYSLQAIDLSDLRALSFVFEWEDMAGTIYIDNIQFVNYGKGLMPTLDPVPAIVNTSPVTISGTKAAGSGIFVNGVQAVDFTPETKWSCEVALEEGDNVIRVFARDSGGSQSEEIVVNITLNPSLYLQRPPASALKIVNDPVWGYKNDSTINVTVSAYYGGLPDTVLHTGYQVEICKSYNFDEAYATFNYWHNADIASRAEPVTGNVNFDVDVKEFVGTEPEDAWETLPSHVYVRVRAARNGFTPSDYDYNGVKGVYLSNMVYLEAPNSAVLKNDEQDSVIRLEIVPRDPRTSGMVLESGYRIDLLRGDKSFDDADWTEMHHIYESTPAIQPMLAYDINMVDIVKVGAFTWDELSAYGVKARVVATSTGFTDSSPVLTGTVIVKNITRLENPTDVTVWNPLITRDRTITVEVINYDPINFGQSVPVKHKKDTRHTGYRIYICKDQMFKAGETYSHYYNYDFEGDGEADLIRAALPGLPGIEEGTTKISIDIDLLAAAPIFGDDFINSTSTKYVYVRLIAIRDGYAVNDDDKVDSYIGFRGTTRLQNPGAHATVYNSEPGNPPDKMDRTITVEVENYDPSGIANGMNLKDKRHAGYRVDLSSTSSFTEGQTYSHYYIYDPNEDGVADTINSTIKENVKIHIDLDVCRNLWFMMPSRGHIPKMVYVRVLAYAPGLAFNYEDTYMPTVPSSRIGFEDRTLLATPATSRAMNPTNSNAGNEVDSSMYITTAATTPGPIAHDSYRYKFSVVSADGKTYSKICPVTGIDPTSSFSATIDIKKLFEDPPYNSYNLADLLGIPVDAKRGVAIEVVSTKEGYTDSAATILTPIIGTLQFKNTSVTFFHLRTVILGASNPVGTSNVAVQLERYVATPPAPPATGVYYEVQCSTDPTFPNDSEVTVTDRSTTVSTIVDKTVTVNVSVLKAIADNSQDYVYVQARFIRIGYTPNAYTVHPSTVTITTLPPMIVDFTATPAAAGAAPSFTVTFSATTLGTVSTYSWDLDGNGTPDSTAASPNYTYNTVGTYTVTLTVTGGGSSDVMTKVGYIKVGDRAVLPGGSIQTAVTSASNGQSIVVLDGTPEMPDYPGDITIAGKNITLIGESVHGTVIKGNILLKDSDSLIKNLTIRYDKGVEVPYGTDDYFKIVTDAGITAINSAIAVDSCVIMPDPDPEVFGTAKQGKGIQIWNLSGSAAVEPAIHNNLILNTDAGIYLYSHEAGGAITGEISNNTLDLNNYGITLRMYTENPAIHHNIITRSKDGIHEVYRDLISVRIGNITDNCFGAEAPSGLPEYSFDNERDVWDEQGQSEVIIALPWDTTGKGNIGVYPDFVGPYAPPTLSYDYTPQNPNCDGMGARLPSLP